MRKLLTIYLVLFSGIYILVSCSSNKDNSAIKNIKTDKSQNINCWVNVNYISCLNSNSIKQCNTKIDNVVLFTDTDKHVWIECYNEYCVFDILKDKKKYSFITYDSISYSLDFINKDSLLLDNELYVTSESWNSLGFEFLSKINGDIFLKKYKKHLKKIYLAADTVFVSYNPFKKVYFLKNTRGCEEMYIVNYKNDSVFIYDFPEKCIPLTSEREARKKLVIKFPEEQLKN
jgi:hypothetical protein